MFYLTKIKCQCDLNDTSLLNRYIPSFVINSDEMGDIELKENYLQIVTKDMGSFVEMLSFMDSLDRKNYVFKRFTNHII
jgi:hypothetical protein